MIADGRDLIYESIDAARRTAGLSWTALAERVGGPRVHTVAALLGQHPLSAEQARRTAKALRLDAEEAERLTEIPGGPIGSRFEIPADPTLYRFYEALGVYGPALRVLLHEGFGDGIMSANPASTARLTCDGIAISS